LRFTDLTLSGEGGFGFQEEVRGDSGSGSDSGNKDDDESLVNRGADAGRGLLDRAKSVIGG